MLIAKKKFFSTEPGGAKLDSIKSRLQTTRQRVSIPRLALTVYQEEGVMGFYRGLWIPLITISFVRTCQPCSLPDVIPMHFVPQVQPPSPSTRGRRTTSVLGTGFRATAYLTCPLSVASGLSHRSSSRDGSDITVPRQWCAIWFIDLFWECPYVSSLHSPFPRCISHT